VIIHNVATIQVTSGMDMEIHKHQAFMFSAPASVVYCYCMRCWKIFI